MSANKKLNLLIVANILSSIGSGISGFTIPWLIIKKPGGSEFYGYLFIGITLLTFFLTPYFGAVIDRFSRKILLLMCELISAIMVTIVIAAYLLINNMNYYLLTILTIVSSLYWAMQIPTLTAFTQEIFTKDKYNKINTAMEVQGQAATFISAGLVGIVVGKVDLWVVFAIDIISSLIAFGLLQFIPYEGRTKVIGQRKPYKSNFSNDLKVCIKYIKSNLALVMFLLCSLTPTIMVLVGNYVNPVYIYKDLNLQPEIQGYASVIYALSAMSGGIIASFLSSKFGNYFSLFMTYTLYLLGMVGIVVFNSVIPFLLLRTFAGVGNSGSRVLRKNIMMQAIPNEIIGRINSLINSFSQLGQSILVGIFSLYIGIIGGRGAFVIIIAIMAIILFVMILANRELVTKARLSITHNHYHDTEH